jgi:hypothetical protein
MVHGAIYPHELKLNVTIIWYNIQIFGENFCKPADIFHTQEK